MMRWMSEVISSCLIEDKLLISINANHHQPGRGLAPLITVPRRQFLPFHCRLWDANTYNIAYSAARYRCWITYFIWGKCPLWPSAMQCLTMPDIFRFIWKEELDAVGAIASPFALEMRLTVSQRRYIYIIGIYNNKLLLLHTMTIS